MFHQQRNYMKRLPWILLAGMLFVFFATSFITSFENKYRLSSSIMHKWLTDFSGEALVYLMGLENPYFTQVLPKESKPPALSSVFFELATSVKPGDIRSLLGSELPGFSLYDSTIIVAGKGTNYTNLTIDSAPPMKVLLSEKDAEVKNVDKMDDPDKGKTVEPPPRSTNGRKVAFIYHTHSWESFLPHLKGVTKPDSAIHSKVNITMVGQRLGEDLVKRGIGTSVDTTNMTEMLKKNHQAWYRSYPMSRQIVQDAMASNKDISLIFDLHRDSARRKVTTATINGKPYAKVMFVIGASNPNYQKNEQMATELHNIIDKKYPGLSRGVERKNKSTGNGIYNQDLNSHAILIEFGGIDNTFTELYRTADVVADAISEYYWQAEKVNGQSTKKQ